MQNHWGHLQLMGIFLYFCKVVANKVVLRPPKDNCELWTPEDFRNLRQNDKVKTGSFSSDVSFSPVQIGVYITHTQWMNFGGCTLRSHNGSCAHRLSGKLDPIVECYQHCNKATFSTYDGCCFCNEYDYSEKYCPAKVCFHEYSGLCGEDFNDRNSGCFCQYQPIHLVDDNGLGNCLKLYHENGQMIRLASEYCEFRYKYFGVPQEEYPRTNWWTAAVNVQTEHKQFANHTFLKNKIRLYPRTYYWVGTFRKYILTNQRPNKTENYCGTVLRTSDGIMRFNRKTCNSSSLYKLCVINEDSAVVETRPRTITSTTESPINTTRLTDGCTLTADNMCTTFANTPTDQEDGISKIGVAIIASIAVVILLMITSFGIFFKKSRNARSSSVIIGVGGSTEYLPAARNEYISQSEMHGQRGAPNGYSEVCIEDDITDSAYHEIEIGRAEAQINTEQNLLGNNENDDQYDLFGNVKKSAAEQRDISDSNYDHIERTMNVDDYDVFDRNDDVTMSDYDQMDKLVNKEYDTFHKKGDAVTDLNTDYDHVNIVKESDQDSRTSV